MLDIIGVLDDKIIDIRLASSDMTGVLDATIAIVTSLDIVGVVDAMRFA